MRNGGTVTKENPASTSALEYPAIGSYAAIGDLRTVALIGTSGAVEWLCLPDIHDPAIFASLLDRINGGSLELGPVDGTIVSRKYRDRTAILETTFEGVSGSFRVTDFLHLFPKSEAGEVEPERELIRVVEGLTGEPEIELSYQPSPKFGSIVPDVRERGKLGWTFSFGADFFLFRTDLDVAKTARELVHGRTRLRAGEKRYVSLSFCRRDIGIIPMLGRECDEKLKATEQWWSGWSSRCDYDGPFADAVSRSLVTLRQLTFSQSGAVVAAATTSLPETIGGHRNWDYRYCWLRDAYFVLASYIRLGYQNEARAYFDWLMHATQNTAPELNILYDVYGRSEIPEREVKTLEGYRRSAPVRVGNAATHQLQLDVYGAVIRAAVEFVNGGGRFGWLEARRLRSFGRVVRRKWRQPDNGLWEMRTKRVHHTFSKAMCWAAMDCLIELHAKTVMKCDCEALRAERDSIREAIEEHAWSEERGAYTGAFGEDWLDASLLLLPKLGFIDAKDPRMVATFERIDEELAEGPFVWRYAHGIDGLEGREGAFLACSFWAVEYLAMRGDVDEAKKRMRALVGCGNDLGLLSEEYDPGQRALLGNFPQAFSHTALISAALAIQQAERNGEGAR